MTMRELYLAEMISIITHSKRIRDLVGDLLRVIFRQAFVVEDVLQQVTTVHQLHDDV